MTAQIHDTASEPDLLERARATIGIFVTLAGIACGLTMLYMGMRAVMGVGGLCAEGGPFVIEQHCPKGVPGLVLGGIWGGIIFYGLYVWQSIKHKVPSFILLGWSALFLSLGWNFLEFGVDPPGTDGGLVWGWLTCAIVFGLMGGLPLLVVMKPTLKGFFGAPESQSQPVGGLFSSTLGATATMVRRTVARPPATPTTRTTAQTQATPQTSELVGELERLTAMHRSGALSDDEFEAAKRQIISEDS